MAQHASQILCLHTRAMRAALYAVVAMGGSLASPPAAAQSAIQPLLDPVVLPDYSRDRNLSVAQTPHPDYDPLGIDIAGFRVFPGLAATSLVNSNVYYDDFNKRADLAELIQPTVMATSDWSHGQVQLYATDQLRRDLDVTALDRNTWSAYANLRVAATDAIDVTAFVQAGHFAENPYTSVIDGNFAALSQYDQVAATLKAAWTEGRVRLTAQSDYVSAQYQPLEQAGESIDQHARDNRDERQMVEGEYALSPSIALYSQASFDVSRYRYANRSSTGLAIVSGFSLDWSGVARGAIGLGYSRREYAAAAYGDPSGLSVEARLELFPSPTTTLIASTYRLLRDANAGQSAAYYDTRAELGVDHALRRNVTVSAKLDYGNQRFVEDPRQRTFYQAGASGKIRFNRRCNADVAVEYSKSTPNSASAGAPFGQLIGSIALAYAI